MTETKTPDLMSVESALKIADSETPRTETAEALIVLAAEIRRLQDARRERFEATLRWALIEHGETLRRLGE